MNITRTLISLCLIIIISSCASLKFINPFAEIKVEDTEPRVTFIDKRQVKIEPSELPKVDPTLVVASYRRLLSRGSPQVKKEALRRLADLTMKLAESKLVLEDDADLSGLNTAVRNATFAEAIALYEQLLSEFPSYKKMADVKYQLARAHSLNREPEQALVLLDQIAVEPVKASSYVESQFRRGESYFVRKKYMVAEKAYSEVLTNGKGTDFYDKALYKRGWSLFKQSLFPEAHEDFFNLLERLYELKIASGKTSSLTDDLIADTMRVISLAFYNQEGALSVQNFFSNRGVRAYESEVYQALAQLYIEQERYQDAADTYLGFVDRNPLNIYAPDFHSQVIDIYKKGGFPSLILPSKEKYVVSYGRNSQFWQVHRGSVTEGIKPQLRTHLNDISKFYHAQAQKSDNPKDYLIAAKWYQEILDTFEEPQIDSQYRFSMAEALIEGKQFAQGAKEFEKVAYRNKSSIYSRDAGYRALVAYQLIKYPPNVTAIMKLSKVIESGIQFVDHFPNDKETAGILSRIAEQQLSIKDIPAAINTSERLLTMAVPPSKKQTDRARIIIANGLFDLKRYQEAEVAISELLQNVKLSRKQSANFHQRRGEAIYKQAEQQKQGGKLAEAVALFLKVGALEASSSVAVNAHFDAATLLLQMKLWSRSAELFESFRKKHPKNALSSDIPEKLALIYEEQKDWNRAAKEYQLLAANNSDPEVAREGYWHVAELYSKSGSESKAIDSFKHYVWTYPQPYLLSQEGRYKLIELYSKRKELDKVTFWRQKLVQFYDKNKKENNARTRFLAAESKFILNEPFYVQFERIKLNLPLGKSLKKKRAAMNKALKAYEQVAGYQVAQYTAASTHKIGQIYQILSKDLMSSQRPKGLDEDELEEYTFLLEDQALPFEDKAIGLFEINAERTKDNIYNQAVRDSINELKKLKPAQYNKSEQLEAIENVSF
ncbi:MAG: tetratricopeptide repeat protein [Kangiellaceae bacterium]|nr:tetratricopeptide repeat protein [Kangiellaceae bacterium]